MAFFDFLGQGVGGMTPTQTAPGLYDEGNIVTQQPKPIGPTWGDVGKAAVQYGSAPGSSAPAVAGMIPSSGWNRQQMNPLDPNAPAAVKKGLGQGQGESDDVLAQITKWFMSLLGSGA